MVIIYNIREQVQEEFMQNFGVLVDGKLIETLPKQYREHSLFDYYSQEKDTFAELFTPELNPSKLFASFSGQLVRKLILPLMGYTMVTHEFCKALSTYLGNAKVLEIMAGNGILSYGLRQYGTNIIATDIAPWDFPLKPWIPDIEPIDGIQAIQKYAHMVDYIIVSWPPMNAELTHIILALKQIKDINLKIIYIGEDCGGCTADSAFWELVEPVRDNNFLNVVKSYHTWFGLHDTPYLLELA